MSSALTLSQLYKRCGNIKSTQDAHSHIHSKFAAAHEFLESEVMDMGDLEAVRSEFDTCLRRLTQVKDQRQIQLEAGLYLLLVAIEKLQHAEQQDSSTGQDNYTPEMLSRLSSSPLFSEDASIQQTIRQNSSRTISAPARPLSKHPPESRPPFIVPSVPPIMVQRTALLDDLEHHPSANRWLRSFFEDITKAELQNDHKQYLDRRGKCQDKASFYGGKQKVASVKAGTEQVDDPNGVGDHHLSSCEDLGTSAQQVSHAFEAGKRRIVIKDHQAADDSGIAEEEPLEVVLAEVSSQNFFNEPQAPSTQASQPARSTLGPPTLPSPKAKPMKRPAQKKPTSRKKPKQQSQQDNAADASNIHPASSDDDVEPEALPPKRKRKGAAGSSGSTAPRGKRTKKGAASLTEDLGSVTQLALPYLVTTTMPPDSDEENGETGPAMVTPTALQADLLGLSSDQPLLLGRLAQNTQTKAHSIMATFAQQFDQLLAQDFTTGKSDFSLGSLKPYQLPQEDENTLSPVEDPESYYGESAEHLARARNIGILLQVVMQFHLPKGVRVDEPVQEKMLTRIRAMTAAPDRPDGNLAFSEYLYTHLIGGDASKQHTASSTDSYAACLGSWAKFRPHWQTQLKHAKVVCHLLAIYGVGVAACDELWANVRKALRSESAIKKSADLHELISTLLPPTSLPSLPFRSVESCISARLLPPGSWFGALRTLLEDDISAEKCMVGRVVGEELVDSRPRYTVTWRYFPLLEPQQVPDGMWIHAALLAEWKTAKEEKRAALESGRWSLLQEDTSL